MQLRTQLEILESASKHLNEASSDLGELSERTDKFREYFFAVNRILRPMETTVQELQELVMECPVR